MSVPASQWATSLHAAALLGWSECAPPSSILAARPASRPSPLRPVAGDSGSADAVAFLPPPLVAPPCFLPVPHHAVTIRFITLSTSCCNQGMQNTCTWIRQHAKHTSIDAGATVCCLHVSPHATAGKCWRNLPGRRPWSSCRRCLPSAGRRGPGQCRGPPCAPPYLDGVHLHANESAEGHCGLLGVLITRVEQLDMEIAA